LPDIAKDLAFVSTLFALSAVISVWGMLMLLYVLQITGPHLQGSAGLLTTSASAVVFIASVVNVVIVALKIPRGFATVFFSVTGVIMFIVAIILLLFLYRVKKRRSN